jgi:hypothetical protein
MGKILKFDAEKGYDVSALPNYVEQHRSELISAAVLAPRSTSLFRLMPNVKGPTTLNLVDVGVNLQEGNTCGFTPDSPDVFSQRTLEPFIFKVNKEWCPLDLLNTYLAHEVEIGAGRETLPFEEKFVADILAKVGMDVEMMMWGNLSQIIDSDSDTTAVEVENSATIYDMVKAVYMAIPAASLRDSAILMSYDTYRRLVMELMEKNLYHYERNVDDSMEMILPGTNTRVIAVPGIKDRTHPAIYAMNLKHVFYGFDAEDDIRNFRLWYSDDADMFRFKMRGAVGVQYAFSNEVVSVGFSDDNN